MRKLRNGHYRNEDTLDYVSGYRNVYRTVNGYVQVGRAYASPENARRARGHAVGSTVCIGVLGPKKVRANG